jgi:hypothetical protein
MLRPENWVEYDGDAVNNMQVSCENAEKTLKKPNTENTGQNPIASGVVRLGP